MEKTIDVTISINGDTISIDFYEHETGDSYGLSIERDELTSPDTEREVGAEILGWAALMLDT